MAKLDLDKFKENADKIILEKSTQGLFSDSQSKLTTLEIDLLEDSPFRIRLDNSNLEKLSESIETISQLEPIIVTKHHKRYQILNGHSRVEAIKLFGGDSVICVVINVSESETPYYPFILNQKHNLDDFEIANYLDKLLQHGLKHKTIEKKLAISLQDYKNYRFEYNLFDVLKNSDVISYEYLKDIGDITDETLRDKALDNMIQNLTTKDDIEEYLNEMKEENIGSKFSLKEDGVRIKKNKFKTTIEIDERHLNFNKIRKFYNFIEDFNN